MKPGTLTLESFTEGDQWAGIPSLTITVNGAAPASALTLVTMRFKKADEKPSDVVALTSATPGQITIVSAANWEITVPPQIVTGLTRGTWKFRIRCTDAADAIKTYVASEKFEVLESI